MLIGFCGLFGTCIAVLLHVTLRAESNWGEVFLMLLFGTVLSAMAAGLTAFINRAGSTVLCSQHVADRNSRSQDRACKSTHQGASESSGSCCRS